MSVSVCLSVCPPVCDGIKCIVVTVHAGNTAATPASELKPSYDPQQTWPPPMKGSSHAMLTTARPSCSVCNKCGGGSGGRQITYTTDWVYDVPVTNGSLTCNQQSLLINCWSRANRVRTVSTEGARSSNCDWGHSIGYNIALCRSRK